MPWRPPTHAVGLSRTLQRAQYDADRATDAPRLVRNTARWRALRRMVLARAPLCANPYGSHSASVAATQVDHILPLRTHPALAYSLDNLQTLCTQCHARKTARER